MGSSHQQLSDTQQIVLNLLPIPSAIISILGSTAIIYIARERRRVQRWTPYTRLLVAMSTCDIILSFCLGIATFLRPKETSKVLWAFGNDATCKSIGFVMQIATAAIWYQGMLSIYFLLTARYGMKNVRFAKRVEPFMHLSAMGYPIGTAVAGAVMDIYGERSGGASCWVASYNADSVSEDGSMKVKDSQRDKLVYLFYAIPMIGVLLCLIYTQMSIYLFVRRHTRRFSSPDESQESSSRYKSDVSLGWSERWSEHSPPSRESTGGESDQAICTISQKTTSSLKKKTPKSKSSSHQSQRLQLVCSQAFLFVMAFGICNACNLAMAVMQGRTRTEGAEMEMLAEHYNITVIQRIFLPIQGLFNFLIFVRPKYLMLRHKFPRERRLWIVKRIFQGNQLRPTPANDYKLKANLEVTANQRDGATNDGDGVVGDTRNLTSKRIPRNMVSSITASDGDFDSILADELGDDDRWHDVSPQGEQPTTADLASGVNRFTTLEVISEMSASVFDLTPYQVNGSHLSAVSDAVSIPTEPSESRWKGTGTPITSTATWVSLCEEQHTGSDKGEAQKRLRADSRPEVPMRMASSPKLPTEAPPTRTVVTPTSSSVDDTSQLGYVPKRPLGIDSKMEVPKRNLVPLDLPMQVPRRTVDTSNVSDVPVRVPRRTSDTSIDYSPMSDGGLASNNSTLEAEIDHSLVELDSKRQPYPKSGQREKKAVSDKPLALPERFISLPPSEIEDV